LLLDDPTDSSESGQVSRGCGLHASANWGQSIRRNQEENTLNTEDGYTRQHAEEEINRRLEEAKIH
jgi:hypothetical protein